MKYKQTVSKVIHIIIKTLKKKTIYSLPPVIKKIWRENNSCSPNGFMPIGEGKQPHKID